MTVDNTHLDADAKAALIKQRTNICPYYQLLGMELLHVSEGKTIVRLHADSRLHQPFGVVHGGAIASLCDAAAGVAVVSLLPVTERSATVEIKVNYLAAVRDEMLTAEGRVINRGRRIVVTEIDVTGEAGRAVAKAIGTFIISRRT